MNGCCGTCKYGHYDKMQGYVCVNDESEYVADFVEYEHWCEDWVSKMMKMIKRLFCRHKRTTHLYTYLERQKDGSWITNHVWKCMDCGKKIY